MRISMTRREITANNRFYSKAWGGLPPSLALSGGGQRRLLVGLLFDGSTARKMHPVARCVCAPADDGDGAGRRRMMLAAFAPEPYPRRGVDVRARVKTHYLHLRAGGGKTE
jgi:hypothetical protein